MSIGLIALLNDVAGLAKVAAATLDDVGAQAGVVHKTIVGAGAPGSVGECFRP